MLALGALYEVAEWVVAGLVDPRLGLEFIGAQGGWDAAKDMGIAFVGAPRVALIAMLEGSGSRSTYLGE